MHLYLPTFDFQTKIIEQKNYVYDIVRRKYVVALPEEMVRQSWIHFLVQERGVPKSLINVEKELRVLGMRRRTDLVVFNRRAAPLAIVECKAPQLPITQAVFEQIARYNLTLQVPFLIVSNGLRHFCCHIHLAAGTFEYLPDVPHFDTMQTLK
ncbi:MAG: type I restriction enzyme HsdR N-terminal domain-containing protein [Sphingobacteriales bacterium]|nr:type I restriction enzyme HsdR N-terminal domain-containing protein [Sphingobacteriales bacterium]